jgi:hypothetical protein
MSPLGIQPLTIYNIRLAHPSQHATPVVTRAGSPPIPPMENVGLSPSRSTCKETPR